ncbi:hypothetical protein Val02_18360 [Virgisporangium aliadipatigenens]|uniref:Solute-binding protein family 5 domain-containing protein n=1 Tax=Virgisporangium aliadipatigenens TaxID=741659 RepID=A0A8J4DNJ1_9ACTN|nr:hypothetical protein Val02_18360 [Virgisporangium aliadipatigenens]
MTVSEAFSDCSTSPNECNGGATGSGGTLTYAVARPVSGWNLNDADANSLETAQVLAGVLPAAFVTHPDLSTTPNPDLLESAEQISAAPQVIEYRIRAEAVWDDGTPITGNDFVYAWRTQNGVDCTECAAASTAGYDRIANIRSENTGRTVTVTFATPFADWRSLFGTLYPSHVALAKGGTTLAASWKWFNDTVPTWSGGPYKVAAQVPEESVTLVPNARWYGRTRPALDKMVFRVISDPAAAVTALRNDEVQAIYPQATPDTLRTVEGLSEVDHVVTPGLGWEHLDVNLANPLLADAALRRAIFTAIDRRAIIEKTVGGVDPDLKPLGSHNYVPSQSGYRDVVTAAGQGYGDVTTARRLLVEAGYSGVGTSLSNAGGTRIDLRVSYAAGNDQRRQIAEVIQVQLSELGITTKITPVEEFGRTITTGDFDLILFAWTGAPFPTANALQTWASDGGGNYGGYRNPVVDDLLKQAAAETDPDRTAVLLNQSDALLTDDAYVLPLFQRPTLLAVNHRFVNVRDNPAGTGPLYNVAEWGLRR